MVPPEMIAVHQSQGISFIILKNEVVIYGVYYIPFDFRAISMRDLRVKSTLFVALT